MGVALRPHILLLLADDYPWELRPAERSNERLVPRIRRHFVLEGLDLQRMYAYPLCAPARSSLLSGRWPHRAYPLAGGMRSCKGLSPGLTNLAERLKEGAGYRTHFVG